MSKSRPVYSRPRTKVYDSNYNLGESYYKPALDRLDMKYGGRGYGGDYYGGPSANGDIFAMRSAPPPPPVDLPRAPLRELEEDDFFGDTVRRRPHSAILGEFDSIFEGRMRNGMAQERAPALSGRTLDEEIEEDMASSMRRLKAKGSRTMEDLEEFESSLRKGRPKLEFSDKLMDSVGLSGRGRALMEEEGARRRFLKMSADTDGEDMMKWTAIRPSSTVGRRHEEIEETSTVQTSGLQSSAAAARARKSRARLEDLESEMQALSEKSAAREKRVRDLRALVQENEASSLDNLQTTVKVKSSIQSEKKSVAF